MEIGKLDRRVRIERFTETVNGFGERQKTWATFLTLWAALDMKSTRQMQEAVQGNTEATKKRMQWRIRYSADAATISALDRLIWKDEVQDIMGVQEMGRGQDIIIQTETAQ